MPTKRKKKQSDKNETQPSKATDLANILICNNVKSESWLGMPGPSNCLTALLTNAFAIASIFQRY